jgi:hypothetical protein
MSENIKGRISDETFDDFLAEQGFLEDAQDVAMKRVLEWKIAQSMKASRNDDCQIPPPTFS